MLLLGCASAPDDGAIVVFAASSLTDAFTELKADFERAHHHADVRLVFAGSQVLRLQIEQGARADVVATADETHLAALHEAGLVDAPRGFAHNELVVIVPPDSSIHRFDDLPEAERLVVGTESVPVGRYAREVIARSDFGDALRARIVSEEPNARLVRAKVQLGEADAAFVYRTDVDARVRAVEIPAAINARATYGIARTTPRGEAWIAHLASERGQTILRRHGFAP